MYHLGCFQFEAILNKAVMNMLIQVFLWIYLIYPTWTQGTVPNLTSFIFQIFLLWILSFSIHPLCLFLHFLISFFIFMMHSEWLPQIYLQFSNFSSLSDPLFVCWVLSFLKNFNKCFSYLGILLFVVSCPCFRFYFPEFPWLLLWSLSDLRYDFFLFFLLALWAIFIGFRVWGFVLFSFTCEHSCGAWSSVAILHVSCMVETVLWSALSLSNRTHL